MLKVKVRLKPIINKINLPTVLKTAKLPGDSIESLFVATQLGEIFCIGNGSIQSFLDLRPRIIKLGTATGGYDERGLLGLAFHPDFYYNGLFYVHYSVAGTQGPGAFPPTVRPFKPDPCDPKTLTMKWTNREVHYDHIDTVEEWIFRPHGRPQKKRTLLNLRRPFMNHNGVNSLNFSPETGKLVLTTGDGGSGYDPFNLSQNDMEIAGKIIEIDVNRNTMIDNPPPATRFYELPVPVQESLTVIAKGVRNIPGITFQRFYHQYVKAVGNVGQDLVESVYTFVDYQPIPVNRLVQAALMKLKPDPEKYINFGWRGWEGSFPTSIIRKCSENEKSNEKIIAYFDEAAGLSAHRLQPTVSYFHEDSRLKYGGTALTGVQFYMGNDIPELTGSLVFIDLARKRKAQAPPQGVLAYAKPRTDGKPSDLNVIQIDYNFGFQPAFFVSLGTNLDQTRLFLGVYGSMKVTDLHKGTVFEIVR